MAGLAWQVRSPLVLICYIPSGPRPPWCKKETLPARRRRTQALLAGSPGGNSPSPALRSMPSLPCVYGSPGRPLGPDGSSGLAMPASACSRSSRVGAAWPCFRSRRLQNLRRHRDEERVRLQHPAEGTQHYDGQTIEHRRSLPTRAQGIKGSNTIAQYGHVLTRIFTANTLPRAAQGRARRAAAPWRRRWGRRACRRAARG